MEQDLPTGRKKRWETTASGCCLMACVATFVMFYRDSGEFTVATCSVFSGLGIGLAVSAIRQRCAKMVKAWIYLVLLSLPPLILTAMALLNENHRSEIRYFWRDYFGH